MGKVYNGEVADGLAGIYYGAGNIPCEWQSTILKRQYIELLCASMENWLWEGFYV